MPTSPNRKPEGRARFVRALLKAVILVLSVMLGVLVASRWARAETASQPPQTVPVRLEAKAAAIRLLRAGREATIVRHGLDRYHRTLGTVAIDGVDLGESLLKLGLALPYHPGREAKAARIAHWCGPGEW